MGDRGQVKITQWNNQSVYLYTHWGASELRELVKEVLSRRVRWGDGPYLSRMIFSQMIKDDVGGELGYGIAAGDCDHYLSVNLHIENQTVEIVEYGETVFTGSFNDFLES